MRKEESAKRFGLIGSHISYSMSKSLHERLFNISGQNATYDIIDIENIGDNIDMLRREYDGFNVTKPFKVAIMDYLDEVDEVARRIGSVNTVVNTNGVLKGYNTDIDGVLGTFDRDGVEIAGKRCLVIGYGGVSKTILAALSMRGASLINITGRDEKKMQRLVSEMSLVDISVGMDKNVGNNYDIVINATTLGTDINHLTPIDVCLIPNIEYYFDLIYNPRTTKMMAILEENGIKATDGLYMLVLQAVKAQQYYLGVEYSKEEINRVFLELAGEMFKNTLKNGKYSSVILVGFMGSGKSSVGRKLADILDVPYIDTDSVIEERYGNITKIFDEYGETYFRELESKILSEVCDENAVIATGGGAVLTKKSREIMANSSAKIVYLNASFDTVRERVKGSNRPLFRDDMRAHELYNYRAPLYKAVAHIAVDSNVSVEHTIDEILSR